MGRPKLPPKYCSIKGCEKLVKARGYCAMHYSRAVKNGAPGQAQPTRLPQASLACTTEGCERESHCNSLCHNHYREQIRRAKGAKPRVKRDPECLLMSCNSPHYSLGYCADHYRRFKATGDPQEGVPFRRLILGRTECDVPGCLRPHVAGGLCGSHHATSLTYGVTTERLIELLSQPCSICGSTENPSIDHDHSCCPGAKSCGKCVRGTVCGRHNRMLGQLGDNPERLLKAAEYLESWSQAIKLS